MRVIKTRRQDLGRVAFAPDGRGLLAVGRHEAVLWPDALGDAKPAKFTGGHLWDAALDAAGRHLIVSSTAGVHVRVLGTDDTREVVGEDDRGHSLVASPVGPEFLLHSRWEALSGWRIGAAGPVQLWHRPPEHTCGPATFLPTGDRFIRAEFRGWTTSMPMALVTHDTATGEVVREVRALEFSSSILAVSPDGRWLAFESGSSVNVYDLGTLGRVAYLPNEGLKTFTAVAFDPAGASPRRATTAS